MLTVLIVFYLLFVICRDGQVVAYNIWAYHDYVYRPYKHRRYIGVQYASNSVPPFKWMRRT